METQDRELLRQDMDRTKQLEYLSSVENERIRTAKQIEQLQKQIYSLTQKKLDLDKEWREGMLGVQATRCEPVLEPKKKKRKSNPRTSNLGEALKKASPQKLAKIADLLKDSGFEL